MKREVPVEQAVGMALAHDMTRIVPGEFKGRAFARGHVITEDDIPRLLDIGKRHIYVLTLDEGELHEDDAATRMAQAIAGPNLTHTDVHEGKVVLKAKTSGMLWVDAGRVEAMNGIDDISVTTRVPFTHVEKGTSVAGVRPIPLTVEESKVAAVEQLAAEAGAQHVIDVLPYQPQRIAIVTTGSEVMSGRIEDKFGPSLRAKFATYGQTDVTQTFVGDDEDEIVAAILSACSEATFVCVTGGMSVDPDDRSPASIRRASTRVITYGTPMLPGSMLMLAYRDAVPIFGLPGAVMYDKKTSFDVLLPRVLAAVDISKMDVAKLGVGGWLSV